MDEDCIHGLTTLTCTHCNGNTGDSIGQADLDGSAIRDAVDELARAGNFRTLDVAAHPAVVGAHPRGHRAPAFNQVIGTYLTETVGRLGIVQVSAKGRSNAVWARRSGRLGTCGSCGSALVPLQYGKPGPEIVEQVDRGEVVLGGCSLTPDSPTVACPTCGVPPVD